MMSTLLSIWLVLLALPLAILLPVLVGSGLWTFLGRWLR
jgi:hypothetical protein